MYDVKDVYVENYFLSESSSEEEDVSAIVFVAQYHRIRHINIPSHNAFRESITFKEIEFSRKSSHKI